MNVSDVFIWEDRFQVWEGRFQAWEGLGGLTDGRTDGWMDKQKSFSVLQDFVPFSSTALLPIIPIYNHAKQGNGYCWPQIALGRPVFCSFAFLVSFSPSVSPSIGLVVHWFVYPLICLFAGLPICWSISQSISMSVCLSDLWSVHPFVCPSVHLSVHPSIPALIMFLSKSVKLRIWDASSHLFKKVSPSVHPSVSWTINAGHPPFGATNQ